MKPPKGTDPAVWGRLTDWQRLLYLTGYRLGRTARALKPKAQAPMPASEPILHYATVRRWRDRLDATDDIVAALRACPNPRKERPEWT